jgi:hypothetical protein
MTDFLPSSLGLLETRTVVINDPDSHACYQVTVPARSDGDAWQFLALAGSGGITGTGSMNLYLGTALPRIREHYYKALQSAEKEIAARRAALGPKLTDVGELRRFVEWASQQRSRIARQWRIPAGRRWCTGRGDP